MNKLDVMNVIDNEFKGKCVDEFGNSRYINCLGQRCVIGLFIPKSRIEEVRDSGLSVRGIVLMHNLEKCMPHHDLDVLIRFQEVHDGYLHEGMSLETQKQILKEFVEKNWV